MIRRTHPLALLALALLSSLGLSSSAVAQTAPGATPNSRSAAPHGFTVTLPVFTNYVVQHGRDRILGAPISNDFQLMGRRVQIFENQVLQAQPDGSVRAMDILSDIFPLAHTNGATFPLADPDILATLPPTDDDQYVQDATAAVSSGLIDNSVPDSWNDLPVNFNTTFRNSVTCADLPQTTPCDGDRLIQLALDVWGLPTSGVQQDPNNPDLVSQRFQRGIMQYSQSAGVTQPVPIGTSFKQVLMGTALPDDLRADMDGSPFLAQYRPTLPLGLARPSELEGTSMASAFSVQPSSLTAAGNGPDASLTPTPTSAFAPALPNFGAAGNDQGVPSPVSTSTGVAAPGVVPPFGATPTPSSTVLPSTGVTGFGTPTVTASGTPVSSGIASGVPIPSTPLGPDPCAGDEQIMFAPGKPYAGTDILVDVTSARHHDVRTVRLAGPVKPGPVSERPGLNGWVWEWTITPAIEGWYDFTFFTDGARACATSGFNALPAFGATPSVTATSFAFAAATPFPTSTAVATPTAQAAPALTTSNAADPATGACAGHVLRLSGTNFGSTQAALNGNVLFAGPSGTTVATILSWTNNAILLTIPTGLGATVQQIVVTTLGGASTPISYQLGVC